MPDPSSFFIRFKIINWFISPNFIVFIKCGLPGGSVVKNLSAHVRDVGDEGSIPRWAGSSGIGNGNPLQYSCLGNPMDRGVWWAHVHGITKSWTRLSTHTFIKYIFYVYIF